jgi:FtsH-binding integral membrane protein
MIIGGIFWSLAYLLIIRQGFKDRTYGMPLAALCANISWEAIFAFLHPHSPPQIYINYAWFGVDTVIVFQFLRYGNKEFPNLSLGQFYLIFIFALVMSFCSILFVTYEFQDWKGAYAAFGQNLMMSILFLWMFFSRNDLRGQSIYIAILKMLGTGISSIAFYLYQPISQDSYLMPFLYLAIFISDAAYTFLVYRRSTTKVKVKF